MSSNLPNRVPCTGQFCAGRCSGKCPVGYVCSANNFGVYRCIQEPPEIWEQWWFWLLIVLGVLLVVGFIYLVYRATRPAKSSTVIKVEPETSAIIKPPPEVKPAVQPSQFGRPPVGVQANKGLYSAQTGYN